MMTTIPIYSADIYLTGSLDETVQIVRQRALIAAARQEGSNAGGIKYLRWPVELVQPLFDAPIADLEIGGIVAMIPLIDIADLSFFQFGKCVERVAIHEVEHLGSNPDIADFFGLNDECPVRRTRNLRWTDFWLGAWVVSHTLC